MLYFILSVGAINALVPILIIIILIGAAAGATRGFSFLDLFAVGNFIGIGPKGKGTLAKSGFASGLSKQRLPDLPKFTKGNPAQVVGTKGAQVGGPQAATAGAAQVRTPQRFKQTKKFAVGTINLGKKIIANPSIVPKAIATAVAAPLIVPYKKVRTITRNTGEFISDYRRDLSEYGLKKGIIDIPLSKAQKDRLQEGEKKVRAQSLARKKLKDDADRKAAEEKRARERKQQ